MSDKLTVSEAIELLCEKIPGEKCTVSCWCVKYPNGETRNEWTVYTTKVGNRSAPTFEEAVNKLIKPKE